MKREIDTSCAISRVCVPSLDRILGHAFPVLDHGFIRVIDYMGDDAAIVQMARVSYGAGTTSVSDDAGLIRYLMRHHHTSPFEGCEIKLHVKLPIFVARQWIRHRTANVNEYSARYSIMEREFYLPEPEVMMKQSQTNKQGRAEPLAAQVAATVLSVLKQDAMAAYDHYEDMIYDDPDDPANSVGLARELARMNLPVNFYTQWYWKTDLHNLLHFLRLRADHHAQHEIRVYAEVMQDIMRLWVPQSAMSAEEYIFGAKSFSASEILAIRKMLKSTPDAFEQIMESFRVSGASAGEVREFKSKLV